MMPVGNTISVATVLLKMGWMPKDGLEALFRSV